MKRGQLLPISRENYIYIYRFLHNYLYNQFQSPKNNIEGLVIKSTNMSGTLFLVSDNLRAWKDVMCATILKDQSLEFVWSLLDAGGKEHCETVWLLIFWVRNRKRGGKRGKF